MDQSDSLHQDQIWHDATVDDSPASTVGPWQRFWRKIRGDKSVLITSAKRNPYQNLRHRERVYAWIQGSRIPFLLAAGAAYVWLHSVWLSAILFVISVPLSWISVVIANGVGEPRDPRAPRVYKPAIEREVLAYEQQQALDAPSVTPENTPVAIDEEPEH